MLFSRLQNTSFVKSFVSTHLRNISKFRFSFSDNDFLSLKVIESPMGNMRYEVEKRVAGEKGDYFVSIIVNGSVWVNLSVSRTTMKIRLLSSYSDL